MNSLAAWRLIVLIGHIHDKSHNVFVLQFSRLNAFFREDKRQREGPATQDEHSGHGLHNSH